MRIASWSWGGRAHVGTISADGREATPLAVADAERGALPLIEAAGAWRARCPAPSGPRVAVEAISLRAPLPKPLRSLFCVGRNYRAHAAELAESVFRASLPAEDAWPIVFSKLADCVIGPLRPGAPAGRGGQHARSTTRASWRSSSAAAGATSRGRGRWTTSSATPSSTTSAPATCRSGTSSGTSARASTPSARWGRGSPPPTRWTAAPPGCAAGSTASCARTATPGT